MAVWRENEMNVGWLKGCQVKVSQTMAALSVMEAETEAKAKARGRGRNGLVTGKQDYYAAELW